MADRSLAHVAIDDPSRRRPPSDTAPAHGGSRRALPLDAESALAQLWRQAHFDDRQITREVQRAVARLVSQGAFDAGLSIEELIVGVTTSWLTAEAPHQPTEMHLQGAFAKLVALSVDEFHRAVRDSEARVYELEHLRSRDPRA